MMFDAGDRLTGAGLIVAGTAIMLSACAWLMAGERRRAAAARTAAAPGGTIFAGLDRYWAWLLVAAVALGFALRLIGLNAKGISHPELYIPNIPLPPDISEPLPRHSLKDTVWWHVFVEPHPPGYYLAMWAWTKVFGTSITALRAPEAILGALSVPIAWRIGALAYGQRTGVLAALLLAAHGFHVFWSQVARMYAPGAFLGLLATWILMELARERRPWPLVEAAYVLTFIAGALTVEFFWVLLGAHILWVALRQDGTTTRVPRLAAVQAMAFILAAPVLSQSVMLGQPGFAPPPTASFLVDYASFGFLLQHGAFAEPWAGATPLATAGVFVLALVLAGAGLRATGGQSPDADETPPPAIRPLVLAAMGAACLMAGLAMAAFTRHAQMLAASVAPLAALAIPFAAARLRPWAARAVPRLARPGASATAAGLVVLLALLPTLALFAISYATPLTAPRAFLIFTPYLLVLAAAGVIALAGRRLAALVLCAALAASFGYSNVLLRRTPTTPRDYRGLAQAVAARMRPDDLIFVHYRSWGATPIFFYLRPPGLVARDYAGALARSPRARVWVLTGLDDRSRPQMMRALAGYRLAATLRVERAGGLLYTPGP